MGLSAQLQWQVGCCLAQASLTDIAAMAPLRPHWVTCHVGLCHNNACISAVHHSAAGCSQRVMFLVQRIPCQPSATSGAASTGPVRATATPARRHLGLSAVTCPNQRLLSYFQLAPGWREFVHQDGAPQAAHAHRGKYEAQRLAAVPQRLHIRELAEAHLQRQGDHLSGLSPKGASCKGSQSAPAGDFLARQRSRRATLSSCIAKDL